MSERKVLNKYYPPEFDPSKIPKLKQSKNRTFSIRIMAPFNMRCNTCGEYIYKGKKFNSRKENVDNEDYLGLRIFRFYIKCPRCVAEIAFKTDLANTDYALEAGATRLFEAEKLAQQMAEQERKEKEEDELNPMKVLENRTKASRNEMEQLDQLEELREMNARHARVNYEEMLQQHMAYEEQFLKLQEEEEDRLVQEIMKKSTVKRVQEDDSDEERRQKKSRQEQIAANKHTDILASETVSQEATQITQPKTLSVGSFSTKANLAGLVKKKVPAAQTYSLSREAANQEADPKSQDKNISTTGALITSSSSHALVNLAGTSKDKQVQAQPAVISAPVTGLGMLGEYSDSDQDESE